jgi:hypothetical protein
MFEKLSYINSKHHFFLQLPNAPFSNNFTSGCKTANRLGTDHDFTQPKEMLTHFVIIVAFSGSFPSSLPIIRLTIVSERKHTERLKRRKLLLSYFKLSCDIFVILSSNTTSVNFRA